MKKISLDSVQLANFRSFVEPTVIDLTTTPGLKLITGDNRAEPRLGANGCGKSTIWDAVCFAFFGSSIKGLRASDLISHGQQQTEVAIVVTIDDEEHSIHRVAPPMRIYLDREQVEQDTINALIHLTKAQFLNSVLFGQAQPLFLDLPVPARGDLLDETLQLEIWMQASTKASDKHRATSNELGDIRNAVAMTTGRLEGLGDLTRFDDYIADWERQRQTRLNGIIDEFEAVGQEHAKLSSQLADDTRRPPLDEGAVKQRYEHMREVNIRARERLATFDTELDAIIKNMDFLADNDICPTCEQTITKEHKDRHNERVLPRWRELKTQRATADLDIQTTGAELPACESTWRGVVHTNQETRSTRMLLERQMFDKQRMLDRLESDAERVGQEPNPLVAEAERARREHGRLSDLLERQRADESQTSNAMAALDYWRQGFRRVRLFCLDTVLQELAVETRSSLLALGLPGWHIDFTTATETKSGTMRLGVQVDIRAPEAVHKFEAMSGGESQRARLAVSLGLANLIQRWSGVRFNVEVFDEPTAFLASQGVEDLLEALSNRASANQKSIWICDHRALDYSFSEIIQIVKDDMGSHVATPIVENFPAAARKGV